MIKSEFSQVFYNDISVLILLIILLILILIFIIHLYDRRLVKKIDDYEKRLEDKGLLKRHFTKRRK